MSVLNSVQRCLGACAVLAAGALAAPAAAQVTPIGPFVGEFSEGFERSGSVASCSGISGVRCYTPAFDGTAEVCGINNFSIIHCRTMRCDGSNFNAFEGADLVWITNAAFTINFFNDGAVRFGGAFATTRTDNGSTGATVEFYDENEALIGEEHVDLNCPGWATGYWEISPPAKQIRVRGNSANGSMALDGLEYDSGTGGGCYPDCDGNTVLDFFDFLCFQNAFLAGDPYADCDENTVLDFFDFLCFQNEFLAGCQ